MQSITFWAILSQQGFFVTGVGAETMKEPAMLIVPIGPM